MPLGLLAADLRQAIEDAVRRYWRSCYLTFTYFEYSSVWNMV